MGPLGLKDLVSPPVLESLVESLDDKTGGSPSSTLVAVGDDAVHRLTLAGLPSKLSRHNHPMAVHTLTKLARSAVNKGSKNSRLIVLSDDFSVGPLGMAIAKAFSLFSMKTGDKKEPKNLHIIFVKKDGSVVQDATQIQAAQVAAMGTQLTARLVDSHPELLTTTQFSKEVEALVQEHSPKVKLTEIVGDELAAKGYGGLHGVGKAANCPPRLIILEYDGSNGKTVETVALVGKGIVYDTGGLSLKPKVGMCGMKHDMGGAGGLLGGFFAAVELGVAKKVVCILCLAENAIGPDAFRNDDILEMYSGKTVEVNNADAEGRLVLGDGVAHATKHIENLDLVVDMATLTGAVMVTTGHKHAGVLCNKPELESRAVQAGMHSGDLCYPLLYAPELLMDEFKSEVADMKNSVKDRANAQASCAGHFIESHLQESYQGGWIHVDMAGPAMNGERSTGYGVGLVLSLLEAPGF